MSPAPRRAVPRAPSVVRGRLALIERARWRPRNRRRDHRVRRKRARPVRAWHWGPSMPARRSMHPDFPRRRRGSVCAASTVASACHCFPHSYYSGNRKPRDVVTVFCLLITGSAHGAGDRGFQRHGWAVGSWARGSVIIIHYFVEPGCRLCARGPRLCDPAAYIIGPRVLFPRMEGSRRYTAAGETTPGPRDGTALRSMGNDTTCSR